MSPEEIALRLRSILRGKRRADQVRERLQDDLRLAMIDPLTGLFNRRYAMARLAKMANQTRLSGKPFAVMIADLDRFKSVNDRFGHAAGDSVLVEIGHRLSAGLRNSDLLARVGGEEFLIALPETDLDEALDIATRLCVMVKDRPMSLPTGQELVVTMSVGVAISGLATAAWGNSTLDFVGKVMECADQALLSSKMEGRNKVSIGRNAA
jgi:two-component system cell cycle response regulator